MPVRRCRQLGLPGPGVVLARGFSGAGTGPIWLDNINCTGSEATLGECQHSPWGIHNCWCVVALLCGADASRAWCHALNTEHAVYVLRCVLGLSMPAWRAVGARASS